MIVSVTTEDIRNGRKASCTECPVALAVARAVPGATLVCVDPDEIIVHQGLANQYHIVDIPLEVRDFVHLFDNGLSVMPFSFELDIQTGELP